MGFMLKRPVVMRGIPNLLTSTNSGILGLRGKKKKALAYTQGPI
nr:MAG TPA: hypothetical protein [Caudoviricetes sp.]